MQEGFFLISFLHCVSSDFFPSQLHSEDVPLSTGVHVNGARKNTPNPQPQMTSGSKHARGVMNMIISDGTFSVLCGNGGTLLGIRNDTGWGWRVSAMTGKPPIILLLRYKRNYSVITRVM